MSMAAHTFMGTSGKIGNDVAGVTYRRSPSAFTLRQTNNCSTTNTYRPMSLLLQLRSELSQLLATLKANRPTERSLLDSLVANVIDRTGSKKKYTEWENVTRRDILRLTVCLRIPDHSTIRLSRNVDERSCRPWRPSDIVLRRYR